MKDPAVVVVVVVNVLFGAYRCARLIQLRKIFKTRRNYCISYRFFLLFKSKMQAQKNWKKKLSVQMPTKKFRNEIIIACLTLHYVIMVCTAIFVNKNFTLGWVHDRPFAVCTPFRSVRRRLKYPVVWL